MYQQKTMDKQNQFLILFAGLSGLLTAILVAKPRDVKDAVIYLLSGMFAAMIIAPAIAEVFTNLGASFSYLSWLKATPDTALFVGLVGLCSMLGAQLVTLVREDLLKWIKGFADRKLGMKNDRDPNAS